MVDAEYLTVGYKLTFLFPIRVALILYKSDSHSRQCEFIHWEICYALQFCSAPLRFLGWTNLLKLNSF